jgi:hypothetical protein
MEIMNRKELLAAIRKIVGRKFEFSEAYIKLCNYPTIGDRERRYTSLTKKYVYISCHVAFGWNEDNTECGAYFDRYPVVCNSLNGYNITKIEYEKLFTKDLQKIYDDIVFSIWWETTVHFPKVKKEYELCKKYAELYGNLKLSVEEIKN